MKKLLIIFAFISCSPEGETPELKVTDNIEAEFFTDNSPFWIKVTDHEGNTIKDKTTTCCPVNIDLFTISFNPDGTGEISKLRFDLFSWSILGTDSVDWQYISDPGDNDILRIKRNDWKNYFIPEPQEDAELSLIGWDYNHIIYFNNL